jgi:hypothetical protein
MKDSVIAFSLPKFKVTEEQFEQAFKVGLLWFHEQGYEGKRIVIKMGDGLFPGFLFLPIEPENYKKLVIGFTKVIKAHWESLKNGSKSDL